jgi:predicted TIM-barrel fold metal-dependent hydrolase
MWAEAGFWATRPLKFLICGGVLERHPQLTVIITEVGNHWVPGYFAVLDAQWDHLSSVLSMLPSEYWQRQCYLGASLLRRTEWPLRDQIGLDHMMYGVDFPHPEGSWQRTKVWLQTLFHDAATVDEVRAVVQDNALRVYDLDRELLRPISDRVGFTTEELLQAPPADLPPEVVNKGDLALA